MAFCANCGTQMGDGVKFCPSCGTPAGGAAPASGPEKEKAGNIVKCPSCGAPVPSMTAVCPECGHEFRNVKTNTSVKEFLKELDAANKTQSYNTINSISTLIKNFPIPNGKEDLFEFIILATSRLTAAYNTGVDNYFSDSWEIKLNDAYKKATILFDRDKSAMEHVESLMSGYHEAVKKKKNAKRIRGLITVAALLAIGFGIFLLFRPTEAKTQAKEDKILIKINKASDYSKVPVRQKSDRLNKLVVSKDPQALEYVPVEMRTEEVCKIAVEKNGSMLVPRLS